MDGLRSERPRTWRIYANPEPSPSQTGDDRGPPTWKYGTSMNAISFGFVATAVLISMFLIMAIFEHLFRPNPSFSSPQDETIRFPETRPAGKLRNTQAVSTSHTPDIPVLMPGQDYPTYIAQPAPLPCAREDVNWPSHDHNVTVSQP